MTRGALFPVSMIGAQIDSPEKIKITVWNNTLCRIREDATPPICKYDTAVTNVDTRGINSWRFENVVWIWGCDSASH